MRIWRKLPSLHSTDLGALQEECPDVSANYEEYMEWYEQKTTYLKVEWLMCTFIDSNLGRQFNNLSAMEIVDELKRRFIAQVRIARFECLDEFLSTKMEENTFLEQHQRKMHRIYYTLVDVWNHEIVGELSQELGVSH